MSNSTINQSFWRDMWRDNCLKLPKWVTKGLEFSHQPITGFFELPQLLESYSVNVLSSMANQSPHRYPIVKPQVSYITTVPRYNLHYYNCSAVRITTTLQQEDIHCMFLEV